MGVPYIRNKDLNDMFEVTKFLKMCNTKKATKAYLSVFKTFKGE